MATEEQETGGEALAKLIVVLASFPLLGWVLKTMWWWFAVPLGVRPIGAAHAIGMVMLLRVFSGSTYDGKKHSVGAVVGHLMLWPLVAMFIGWIVKTVGL